MCDKERVTTLKCVLKEIRGEGSVIINLITLFLSYEHDCFKYVETIDYVILLYCFIFAFSWHVNLLA